MKKTSLYLGFSLLLLVNTVAYSTIDPARLTKITKENNPDCVEYYIYKGVSYCSTAPTDIAPIDIDILKDEKQHIHFDDRIWKAAWGKKNHISTTIEYVPEGEDIKKWNELVTSQVFPGIQEKLTPMQFVHMVAAQLQKSGLKTEIRILYRTPSQVIFEFRIHEPENLKQNEIQKITKGSDGYYVLHYAIKENNMSEENRQKWLKLLQSSYVK